MKRTINAVVCPRCGAPIRFEEGRDETFCASCGCHIFADSEKSEKEIAHEDKTNELAVKLLFGFGAFALIFFLFVAILMIALH